MGSMTLKNYLSLCNMIKHEINKANYDKKKIDSIFPIKKFLVFSFHFFNVVPLMYMIQKYNFDQFDFVINCIRFSLETVKEYNMNYDKNSDDQIISQLWYMSKLLAVVMKKDDQHQNIQQFIDSYSSLLVGYDSPSRFLSFAFLHLSLLNQRSLQSYLRLISKKQKPFLMRRLFSNLLKLLRSENDLKSDSLFGENEVPISSFLPLHHLFYCLFSS